MTDSQVHKMAVRVGIALFVLLAASFAQSYSGRMAIRNTQLHGCVRGQKDRAANADGWEAAFEARSAAAKRETGAARDSDLLAAARYAKIVKDLDSRITARNPEFRCDKIYPKPNFIG